MKIILLLTVLFLTANFAAAQKPDKVKNRPSGEFTGLVDEYADEIKAAQKAKAGKATPAANVSKDTIILNKGWGKIVLGASETDVKRSLGQRPLSGYESVMSSNVLIYPEKGAAIWTNRNNKVVKILFFGDHSLNPPGYPDLGNVAGFDRSTVFKTFAGVPEKVSWRASAAQTIAAYGKPDKQSEAKYGDISVTVLKYGETSFYFRDDKLIKIYFISPDYGN